MERCPFCRSPDGPGHFCKGKAEHQRQRDVARADQSERAVIGQWSSMSEMSKAIRHARQRDESMARLDAALELLRRRER